VIKCNSGPCKSSWTLIIPHHSDRDSKRISAQFSDKISLFSRTRSVRRPCNRWENNTEMDSSGSGYEPMTGCCENSSIKGGGISWIAERLSASQDGFYFMDLFVQQFTSRQHKSTAVSELKQLTTTPYTNLWQRLALLCVKHDFKFSF
jgi:hypothetical protein